MGIELVYFNDFSYLFKLYLGRVSDYVFHTYTEFFNNVSINGY